MGQGGPRAGGLSGARCAYCGFPFPIALAEASQAPSRRASASESHFGFAVPLGEEPASPFPDGHTEARVGDGIYPMAYVKSENVLGVLGPREEAKLDSPLGSHGWVVLAHREVTGQQWRLLSSATWRPLDLDGGAFYCGCFLVQGGHRDPQIGTVSLLCGLCWLLPSL